MAALALLAGCELTEVRITAPQDVVVAEALVLVPDNPSRQGVAWVMLHRTLDETGKSRPVPGAVVEMRRSDGAVFTLPEVSLDGCVTKAAGSGEPGSRAPGTCYRITDFPAGPAVLPGDRFELTVELPDGGELRSATRVPGPFQLLEGAETGACWTPPDRTLEVRWSQADRAWAYVLESAIFGLPAALEPRGIEVEDDPLVLVGVSLSQGDTSLVFPSEIGLFDRFDLDRDVALVLQTGLPPETNADVVVAAVDRNYVNWARGGNFNPSGQVRVPSVVGDGTGFFGSAVLRSFRVEVLTKPSDVIPRCPAADTS